MSRRLFLLAVSPIVCTVIGAFAGGIYISMAGIEDGLSVSRVALNFPMAMLASLVVVLPVGLVTGLLGASLALVLERTALRLAARSRWLQAGAGAGGVGGLLVALLFLLIGLDSVGALLALGASWLSGTAVGWLGWREFGGQATS